MGLIRLLATMAALTVAAAPYASAQPLKAVRYYQGRNRGAEQSEPFSRKVRVGRDGQVSISNISGLISVTATGGDEMTIDAVKRGNRSDFDRVDIVVDEHPGRVDVRTDYPRLSNGGRVDVDYTVAVPAGVSLEVHSISGRIRIDGVKGSLRVNSVSGDITSSNTPKVEFARSVSGQIDLGGISHDGSLSVSTVSGNVIANGMKARSLDVTTVSGEVRLTDAAIERLNAKVVSGHFEYAGRLARNGRYDVNSHSGEVRFTLNDNTGFQLNAGTFSGAIRSDFQMTVGGDSRDTRPGRGPGRGTLQSTFGDGSASLNLRTFSGGITIAKK